MPSGTGSPWANIFYLISYSPSLYFFCSLPPFLDPSNIPCRVQYFPVTLYTHTKKERNKIPRRDYRARGGIVTSSWKRWAPQRDQLTYPNSCSTQSADLRCIHSFIHPICLYYILGIVLGIRDKAVKRKAKTLPSINKREFKILSGSDKCWDIKPGRYRGEECQVSRGRTSQVEGKKPQGRKTLVSLKNSKKANVAGAECVRKEDFGDEDREEGTRLC